MCRRNRHEEHKDLLSRPLHRLDVDTRGNLGARYRWGIEGAFQVEKHQGHSYEHAFAKQWNAMKGYHYLMRLTHLFNTLARFSKELAELFPTFGVQGVIGFVRNTLTGPWLDPQEIEQQLKWPFRLRLVRLRRACVCHHLPGRWRQLLTGVPQAPILVVSSPGRRPSIPFSARHGCGDSQMGSIFMLGDLFVRRY